MPIFSVDAVSVWDVFDWQAMMLMFAIPISLISFPKLANVWPFNTYVLFQRNERLPGIIACLFVSFVAVLQFLMTTESLRVQRAQLAASDLQVVFADFDGQQPSRTIAWTSFPEFGLTFDGNQYGVPGSLHGGAKLLPEIRERLVEGQRYRLAVSDGVILNISEAE